MLRSELGSSVCMAVSSPLEYHHAWTLVLVLDLWPSGSCVVKDPRGLLSETSRPVTSICQARKEKMCLSEAFPVGEERNIVPEAGQGSQQAPLPGPFRTP